MFGAVELVLWLISFMVSLEISCYVFGNDAIRRNNMRNTKSFWQCGRANKWMESFLPLFKGKPTSKGLDRHAF